MEGAHRAALITMNDDRRWIRLIERLPWWVIPCAVSIVFLPFTFAVAQGLPWREWCRPLSLGTEQGVATWWQGMLLLHFALAVHGCGRTLAPRDRGAKLAAYGLSVVGFMLFCDEMGSIHERAELMFPFLPGDLNLIPIAVVGAAILVPTLATLFHKRQLFGRTWWLVVLAFFLFGSVYIQEFAEHRINWPRSLLGIRLVVEEGTELVGMIVLLAAAAEMTRRQQRDARLITTAMLLPPRETAAVFAIAAAALALPAIVFRILVDIELLQLPRRGDFVMTMPLLLYALAAIAAIQIARLDWRCSNRWLTLALVLFLLSLAAECLFYHYLPFVEPHWSGRTDLDQIWAVPLLFVALIALPDGRRWLYLVIAAAVYAIALVSALSPETPLAFVVPLLPPALIVAWTCHIWARTRAHHGDSSSEAAVGAGPLCSN